MFPEDLVQEYEATQGQLVNFAAGKTSNDTLIAIEASAKVAVTTELTHTPLPR